jgi:hypothetical protein
MERCRSITNIAYQRNQKIMDVGMCWCSDMGWKKLSTRTLVKLYDLAISKGINIDGVDSQTLFSLVRRVRAPPVTFGHIDSIQEGGLYSRTYLYKVS